jgi:hypothetical protein
MTPDQNNDSVEQLKQKLKSIILNPKVAEKALDLAVGRNPVGWSKKSVCTYYKHKYGLEARGVLDEMMRTKEPVIYEYDYFANVHGINPDSLYQRVNTSIRYVVDRMDTDDHKYGRFNEMIKVSRDRKRKGVVIEILPQFLENYTSDFKPRAFESKVEAPKWRQLVEDYLQNGETGVPFYKDRLCLTTDEITQLKTQFSQLKNVISVVTSSSIKLCKVNI